QAIARDIRLAKSFPRIQELARRLVPWEHMGFARYDAERNEMELVADTATGHRGSDKVRFDANAGLSGEAVRRRRPVVAGALAPARGVVSGRGTPGSEAVGPACHAGPPGASWRVRQSTAGMAPAGPPATPTSRTTTPRRWRPRAPRLATRARRWSRPRRRSASPPRPPSVA